MDNKYVQQFKKGSLEMILLCLIAKKETYGYEIIAKLNENGAAVLGYAKKVPYIPCCIVCRKPALFSAELLMQRPMAV